MKSTALNSLVIAILIFLFSRDAFAQKSPGNKLRQQISRETNDTVKINLMIRYMMLYATTAFEIEQQALRKKHEFEQLQTRKTMQRNYYLIGRDIEMMNRPNSTGAQVNIADLKDENGKATGTKVELIIPF